MLVFAALLFGCLQPQAPAQSAGGKPIVVVTAYFLEDFAKGVAGDRADVVNLLPDGANLHSFEPGPRDLETVYSARVFVYNGAGLEAYTPQIAASIPQSVITVEASSGVKLDQAQDAAHGPFDPHVWLDPVLAKQEVGAIKNALAQADPKNADYYDKNAKAYSEKLDSLNAEIANRISKFSKKEYVGFHPAFSYFNKRYGLKYAAVIEEFAGDEPSAKEMANIVDVARQTGINTVFAEPNLDPRAAYSIAQEINGTVLLLQPMETLSPQERADGKDYFALMRENVETLARVLS